MKLDECEKDNVYSLLSYLVEHDLMALSRTVTNQLLNFESVNDAIEAIILHETDIKSLLSRRKVTREILFKYLHDKKVDIPANSEKNFLIKRVIELWDNDFTKVSLSTDVASTSCAKMRPPEFPENIGDVNMLAEKFASWFYSIINDYVLSMQSAKLSVEHFWKDCSLHLVMESPTQHVVQDVHKNANEVVSLLQGLLRQHKLYFNPNISSTGVRGKVDASGLVLVLVCGTLHQVDNCVGIFQQIFGLLRDPFMENNWKIKSSSVVLKSVGNSDLKIPSIGFEDFSLLKLPSN